jgi:hypothetical protein
MGYVQQPDAVAERQHASVIAVLEHHDARSARVVHRRTDRHQVRLGAGVGETHLFDRCEPGTHQTGQLDLQRMGGADGPTLVELRHHRISNRQW